MKYFPELDYWFSTYWNARGDVTVQTVDLPVTTGVEYTNSNIFQLLFSETFPYDYYVYTFKSVSITTLPRKLIDRLCVKNTTVQPYLSDSTSYTYDAADFDGTGAPFATTGQPILFEDVDHVMFQLLMQYRKTGSVSLTSVDTSLLTTDLSYLIYLYLSTMQTTNYSTVDDMISYEVDSTNVPANMFYLYMLNESHKKLKTDNVILENSALKTRMERLSIHLTETELESNCIPVELCEFVNSIVPQVYLNTRLLSSNSYTITPLISEDTTDAEASSYLFCWDTTSLDAKPGDYLTIDYYTTCMEADVYEPDSLFYSWDDGTTFADEE